MTTTRRVFTRALASAGVTAAFVRALGAQTPQAGTCEPMGTPAASHGAGHHDSTGHGTPMAGMHDAEFDQMYIDMMLPHHESVIALAEVAEPVLEDPRLKEMARNIIDTQSQEQTELQDLREEWYGSRDPEPMSHEMMNRTMGHASCAPMDQMMNSMDPEWQVKTFLAADTPDLAFIEQTIPHHQMAIDSSKVALEQAVHPELKEIAREVIKVQQEEIDLLEAIRTELTGEGTPAG